MVFPASYLATLYITDVLQWVEMSHFLKHETCAIFKMLYEMGIGILTGQGGEELIQDFLFGDGWGGGGLDSSIHNYAQPILHYPIIYEDKNICIGNTN